jgi:hypothetical protein
MSIRVGDVCPVCRVADLGQFRVTDVLSKRDVYFPNDGPEAPQFCCVEWRFVCENSSRSHPHVLDER